MFYAVVLNFYESIVFLTGKTINSEKGKEWLPAAKQSDRQEQNAESQLCDCGWPRPTGVSFEIHILVLFISTSSMISKEPIFNYQHVYFMCLLASGLLQKDLYLLIKMSASWS